MTNKFTCAMCGHTFDKGWSDEEAEVELKEVFDMPKEECDLVCDSCYKLLGFGNA